MMAERNHGNPELEKKAGEEMAKGKIGESPEALDIKNKGSEIYLGDDAEEIRESLLEFLPHDLQLKWADASTQKIREIVEKRRELGYEAPITGYHVSQLDLPIGGDLVPGKHEQGRVFYTTQIDNLYGRKAGAMAKGGLYLYIIQGTPQDKDINKNIGWRTTCGKVKIIDKIPLNADIMKDMGADFADVAYH